MVLEDWFWEEFFISEAGKLRILEGSGASVKWS